jgi:hypothetical protein
MKCFSAPTILLALLAGCATPAEHEGLRTTQTMTDMDGRPIDPGRSGTVGIGVGVGVGIGSWGRRGGAGVGFGMGW